MLTRTRDRPEIESPIVDHGEIVLEPALDAGRDRQPCSSSQGDRDRASDLTAAQGRPQRIRRRVCEESSESVYQAPPPRAGHAFRPFGVSGASRHRGFRMFGATGSLTRDQVFGRDTCAAHVVQPVA